MTFVQIGTVCNKRRIFRSSFSISISLFLAVLAFFVPVFFTSCEEKHELPRVDISKQLLWCEADEDSSVFDAMSTPEKFVPLENIRNLNLEKLTKRQTGFVWIKTSFVVPKSLRGNDLSLLISYIHYAEEVFLNGNYIGSYGRFPPKDLSAFYIAHYYPLPISLVDTEAENTLYIKIYCKGKSTIAGKMFIGDDRDISTLKEKINFFRSTLYVFFEGVLFVAFMLFVLLFMADKKSKFYHSFAMMNFFTMFFIVDLFSGTVPIYAIFKVSYTWFIKVFRCMNLYIIVHFFVHFNFYFMELKEKKVSVIIRVVSLLVKVLLTLVVPTYEMLIKITPLIVIICILEFFYGIYPIIWNFRNKVNTIRSKILIFGLCPLLLTMIVDLIIRLGFGYVEFPFFTVFGWMLEIILLIIVLAVRFSRTAIQNEHLTHELKAEVNRQTKNLMIANENLAKEIFRAHQDLEMASLVQSKYFPEPKRNFRGWSLAVSYNALSDVSGDLYDYYFDEENLEGLSLFDVSGHGLSASLVTMLAKNIIASVFEEGKRRKKSISEVLYSINERISDEKGSIDNYLTGLIFRFENGDDSSKVQMADAGHPYPILFSKKTGEICELKHDDSKKHYGAIGIQGIAVSFPEVDFIMEEGDILLCYTDGLTESTNENGEQFGSQRAMEIIRENSEKSAEQICTTLMRALNKFSGHEPRTDDVTVIILKKENPSIYEDTETENFDQGDEIVEDVIPIEEI